MLLTRDQFSGAWAIIRPRSWVKNLFVFTGIFFSSQLDNKDLLISTTLIFLQFCAFSSGIYCLNDIIDAKADAQHPVKKSRPIPSGRLSRSQAWIVCLTAFTIGIGLCVLEKRSIPMHFLYVAINGLYSTWIKHIPILDILSIAIGFLLRILIGTYPLGILPSHWLLFCGFSLTLFISITKRYLEYKLYHENGSASRQVLQKYNMDFLRFALVASLGQTLIGYTLFAIESKSTMTLLSILPATYGVLTYVLLITQERESDDPVKLIVTSPQLIGSVCVWSLFFLSEYYLRLNG